MVIVLGDPYDTDSQKRYSSSIPTLKSQFHKQKQYCELRIPEKAKWK